MSVSAEAPAAAPASRGNGLAILALLVGVAGVGIGCWGVWQVRALETRDQQQLAQLDEARTQAAALGQRAERLDGRLKQLPSADELEERRRLVAQLQGDQQLLNQRLETVLGASRQDWRLAEAEHLLRLASLRLSALQDIASAEALVQGADEILRDQNDPASFAAREQLAKSLEALRTTVNPDRTGLFLQLGALREQAVQLNSLNPDFDPDGGVLSELAAEAEGTNWWSGTLQTLSQYFRIDFNADQNVRPLLAGQSLAQVRLALSLSLEQAQWAALHGQTQVYRQALTQAGDVLDGSFNRDNPNSRALRARIGELVDQPIEVAAPDLSQSLTALQAYIERKQSARDGQEAAPAADTGSEDARP
ncbi:uroporphyrinogen-III C-methyltransferase [Pseudomonas sp. GD03944]|uniref:uroporphyrinogen-III C-methyltransferase n=1 Tax=Pseudomonas sp. GD03944 TaxID=2975409 RepID=UPI002449AC77|nr:uroporphyrinogen-III C-methyltransferase [Pseudomonas sp. GD03944]MDH1263997.1 uroporphyrinogen-III C-methyltransferase [Pseudomonas sp. GD03944]